MAIYGDPALLGIMAPIKQYHKELWSSLPNVVPNNRVLGLSRLASMWRAIWDKPPARWRDTRGPIGALFLSLGALGLAMPDPFTIDIGGAVYNLCTTSPKMICALITKHWAATLEQRALAKFPCPLEVGSLVEAKRMVHNKSLSAFQAGTLASFLCQCIWTRTRLQSAGYQVDSTLCPRCGLKADTVFHRLWECSCTEDHRKHAFESFELEAIRDSPGLRQGVAPSPLEYLPGPCTTARVETWSRGGLFDPKSFFEGSLYSDGSATQEYHPAVNRSGWAVVSIDARGEPLGPSMGHVPATLPQTSAAGEHMGFACLMKSMTGPARAVLDYQGIVDFMGASCARGVGPDKMYGGTLREALVACTAKHLSGVTKVKSHLNPDDYLDDKGLWLDIKGNHMPIGTRRGAAYCTKS